MCSGCRWVETISSDRSIVYSLWGTQLAQCLCLHEAYHDKMAARLPKDSGSSAQPARHALSSQLPSVSTMDANSRRQKRQDNVRPLLNAAIEAMNLAKEVSSATPAKAIFGSVSILLTMIMVRFLLSSDKTFQVHV